MNKLNYSSFTCLKLLLLFAFTGIRLASYANEEIHFYNTLILVNADRSVTITETIKVNVEGIDIRRGIYRDILNVQINEQGRRIRYPVEVLQVLKNGQSEPFITDQFDQSVRIRIGDADILLEPGIYEYTVKYKMPEQIRFFEEHDEIYWNAVGTDWQFPILEAEARVVLPGDAEINSFRGYSGYYEETGCACTIEQLSTNELLIKTTESLNPYEGLSIAVGFDKGLIEPPSEAEKDKYVAKPGTIYLIGYGGLGFVLIYFLVAWYFVGRDPMKGTIVPHFGPPKNISPAVSRSLNKMGFDKKSFTASVISLAVKGAIRLEKIEDGYELHKRMKNTGNLSKEEKVIFNKFLMHRDSFTIDKSYSSTVKRALELHEDSLKKELSKVYFNRNQGWLVPGILVAIVTIIGGFISTGAYDPSTALALLPVGIFSIIFFPIAITIFRRLVTSSKIIQIVVGVIVLAIVATAATNYFDFIYSASLLSSVDIYVVYFLAVVIGSLIILVFLFSYLIKVPTVAGRKLMDQVDGLKMYLNVAEKDRLEEMHAPEQNISHFEALLPYAIALDEEKHWSGRFEKLLANSEEEYRPTWYSGRGLHTFTFSSLTNDIGRSFSSSVSTASTPPQSSSSSGSFGGGFSGGGGGGGGGGGW